MSQKRLTDFYAGCKKPDFDGSKAKRRKIMVDDVHSGTTTSIKRQSGRRKQSTAVQRPAECETPQKGFHFHAFVSDSSVTPDEAASSSTPVLSAKKRLVLKPSPKRRQQKEAKPTVFEFVGNLQSHSAEISEVDATSVCEKVTVCNKVTDSKSVPDTASSKVTGSTSVPDTACKEVTSTTSVLKVNKVSTRGVAGDPGKPVSSQPAEIGKLKKNAAKLTAAEMKAKLSKCGGLAELKQRLKEFDGKKVAVESKVSSKVEKSATVSKICDSEAKKHEKSTDVNRAPKESSDPENTTETVVSSAKPAHERYHSLAEPTPPTLSLPLSYQILRDLFSSADTTVSMLDKRSEICTFHKLADTVQSMTKRAFGMKQLGQIKTVFPTAYLFRQERNLHKSGARTSEYQLTIQAILDGGNDDPESSVVEKPRKQVKTKQSFKVELSGKGSRVDVEQNVADGQKVSERTVFSLNRLLERRTVFFTNLINIVKTYHREFLVRLGLAGSCSDDKILRWHPRFNVDSVPEIEPAELPKPPEDDRMLRTASDVLKQASKSQRQLNPVLQRALEKVSAAKMSANEKSSLINHVSPSITKVANQNCSSMSAATAINQKTVKSAAQVSSPAVKGIPQSLLERVRAKEALIQECAMMRSEETDKRIVMLERLPELLRILRGEFVMRKKPALQMRECCQRITDSYKSRLSADECESHIRLMTEVAPELVTIAKISSGVYVRLDTNIPLTTISDKITKLHKQALLQ